MAEQEWILGQSVETDNTNYEWLEGKPYILVEEEAPVGIVILRRRRECA